MFGYGSGRVAPADSTLRDIERAARRGNIIRVPDLATSSPLSPRDCVRMHGMHRAGFVSASEALAARAGLPCPVASDTECLPLPAKTLLFEMEPAEVDYATRRVVIARRGTDSLRPSLIVATFGAIADSKRWTMTVPLVFTDGGLVLPPGVSPDNSGHPVALGLMHEVYWATLGLRVISARHQASGHATHH